MTEHKKLPTQKTHRRRPEWGKYDEKIVEWTVICSCGWHAHVLWCLDIPKMFNWHLEEEARFRNDFLGLVAKIQKEVDRKYQVADVLEFFGPLLETLKASPAETREQMDEFIETVARLLNDGDVDWDHAYWIASYLEQKDLYVVVEKPRTKKPKPSDTAKALGIKLDDDDEDVTPALSNNAPDN